MAKSFRAASKQVMRGAVRASRSRSTGKTSVSGCLGVIGSLFLFSVLACCGFGGLVNYFAPAPKTASVPPPVAVETSPAPVAETPEPSAPIPDVEQEPQEPEQPVESLPTVPAEPDPAPAAPKAESRTWTASNGTNTVEATLVQFNETHVQLKREDTGKLVAIELAKLSEADQRYVDERRNPVVPIKVHNEGAEVLIGKVTRVLDGDTVHLDTEDGETTTIRLEGVDAPEKDQRFGPQATRWLIHQLSGNRVQAEISDTDRYGRSLGHLYVDDRWINQELVEAGFAWHYVQYSKDVRLAEAQNNARSEPRGLWVDARKVAPWDWRNGQRVETAIPANVPSTRTTERTVFITDTGTKYHRRTCRHLHDSHYEIPLSRAMSAYEACKTCNP